VAAYRLLVVDIDGTLLDPGGSVRPRTRAALRAAMNAGTRFVLATARRYGITAPIADMLELNGPLILYDGAQIKEHPSGHVLAAWPLQQELSQQVCITMTRHGIQPIMQLDRNGEVLLTGPEESDDEWVRSYLPLYQHEVRRLSYAELYAQCVEPLRVVAFAPPEPLRAIREELRELPCQFAYLPSGSYGTAELSAQHVAATKGEAVRTLARMLDIPLSETMVVGDSFNDISMFAIAGLSIAMGQAPQTVAEHATARTTSNMEDGLALAIERYILQNSRSLEKTESTPNDLS
jgi:Cof subfamily protein (haloacid dehalogenase superfamily)